MSDAPPPMPTDVAPQAKAPSVSKAPPAGKKFPCNQCGARLDFDPGAAALKCPYCGHTQGVEAGSAKIEEKDLFAYAHKDGAEKQIEGRSTEVRCGGCGASVLIEDAKATDTCPYCASHLENKPETSHAMVPPEGLLPFGVEQRKAIENFNAWITSRWFAPNDFSKLANLGKLNGVYMPFWTYDSLTFTHYSGMRGDDYYVTETYTEKDDKGESVTKTRQVRKTRWWPVSGRVDHFFDDVLIYASKSLPEHLVNQLEPWDLPALVDFKPDFLSGFQTERYKVGLEEGFTKAREVMDTQIREMCRQDMGGDHQNLHSVETMHLGVTFKHVLLPAWLAAYRYQDAVFRVMVNGRTGEVVGDRPWSWMKIASLAVSILAVIGVIVFFATRQPAVH